MKSDIFIIIVTYNGMKWLKRCLESVISYPVVVIDNNSQDGSVKYIEEHFPQIHLIKSKTNLGFGKANNIGLKYAITNGAKYCFLLNQDAYLKDGSLEILKTIYKQDSKNGILSPIHLNGSGSDFDKNFFSYIQKENLVSKLLKDYITIGVKRKYSIEFVNAAGWFISSDVIKKVGVFDPIFFHYGEDNNYCQRILYHNYKIAIVPEAILYHDRESRKVNVPKNFSNDYYASFRKYLLIEFGDINKSDVESKIEDKLKFHKRNKLKCILNFNFREYQDSHQKIRCIKELLPNILESRNNNKLEFPEF